MQTITRREETKTSINPIAIVQGAAVLGSMALLLVSLSHQDKMKKHMETEISSMKDELHRLRSDMLIVQHELSKPREISSEIKPTSKRKNIFLETNESKKSRVF